MTTTSIDIDRPADDVFAYVTNPTQFHEWQKASSPVV
ncbi:MAG TPA: SRPBCC family protein [Nocardioidaceae bacterium]|nr:SRPBCC family protein [Nocardioidaceae bacterium]